jgi:hypothetical protein
MSVGSPERPPRAQRLELPGAGVADARVGNLGAVDERFEQSDAELPKPGERRSLEGIVEGVRVRDPALSVGIAVVVCTEVDDAELRDPLRQHFENRRAHAVVAADRDRHRLLREDAVDHFPNARGEHSAALPG